MAWNTSWGLYGNADTSISNFLGTTDARPLLIKTSGRVALRVSAGGDVAVGLPGGTRSPDYKLDVGGVLNADEIYKDGAPLIGSRWRESAEGIAYKGGNVGIRTASPTRALQVGEDVNGVGFDTSDVSPNAGYVRWGDNTGWKLHFGRSRESPGAALNFGTAGVLMTLQDDGSVGIGTSTPGARLDVSGSGGAAQCCAPVLPTLSLSEDSKSAGRQAWLQFHNGGEAEAYLRLAGHGPAGSDREGWSRLEIGDSMGGSTGLVVQGRVGIGISAPAAKLHVADTGGSFHAGVIRSDVTENVWKNQLVLQADKPLSEARLGFSTTRPDGSGHHTAIIKTVVPPGEGGELVFQTRAAGFGPITEHLRITREGNVGIGTTAPRTRLEVRGSLTLEEGTSPVLFTGTGTSELNRYLLLANSPDATSASGLKVGGVLVSDDYQYANPSKTNLIVKGSVGIGTSAPAARLHVAGGGSVRWGNNSELVADQGGSIELGGNNITAGTGTPYIDFHSGLTQGVAQDFNTRIINDADGRLSLIASILRATGSVGIGTASPGAKLHVAGGLWNPSDTEADFKIGDATYRLKIGVATGGGGAGDVRIRAHGGTNRLMLGSGTLDTLFVNGDRVGIGTMTPEARLDVAGGDVRIEGRLGTHGYSPTPRNAGWGGGIHTWDIEAEATIWSRALRVEGGAVISPGTSELWFFKGPAYGSDSRLKRNVERLAGVLERLEEIRGVSFERISPSEQFAGPREIGVIAQEVEPIFPELVSTHGEGGHKAVDYGGLTGVLIEATKELKAQNDELRDRIEALELEFA